MDLYDLIKGWVKNEMHQVLKAKAAFALTLLFAFITAFVLISWINSGTIEALKAAIILKDAHISKLSDSRTTIKTLIFDINGNTLSNIGAEELIDKFKVSKQGVGNIVIELHTTKYLEYIPTIEPIIGISLILWDKIDRIGPNTIMWTGIYSGYDDNRVPQFKMEIYQE